LRVHLSEMGHPILGDPTYGRSHPHPYFATRCLLHAQSVAFDHPISGKALFIEAPLPADFAKALHDLRIA